MLCGGSNWNYASGMKTMADFGRAAIGWTKMTDLFVWFKELFMDLYYRNMCGKTLEEVKLAEKFPMFEQCMAKCRILRSEAFDSSFLDRDPELCKALIKLEDNMIEMRFAAIRARELSLQSMITLELTRLFSVFQAARNSAAALHKRRPAPTTLYVYGEAGVGKSNLLLDLQAAIYAKKYKDDPEWTLDTLSHTRAASNEFWDGILPGQPVVVYDDIFQVKDTTSMPNPEIFEIIRIKNEAPYHLHMSSIEDKKNCYFTSKFVLCTSNVQQPQPVSISDKNALYRRFDISIEVTVKPAYGKTAPDGSPRLVIDKRKAGNTFNPDIYDIQVYDMATKNPIGQPMDYDDFVNYFFRVSDDTNKAAQDLHDSIRSRYGLGPETQDQRYSEFLDTFNAQIGWWGRREHNDIVTPQNPLPTQFDLTVPQEIFVSVDEIGEIGQEDTHYLNEDGEEVDPDEATRIELGQQQQGFIDDMLRNYILDWESDFEDWFDRVEALSPEARSWKERLGLLLRRPLLTPFVRKLREKYFLSKFTLQSLYNSPLATLGEWIKKLITSKYWRMLLLGCYGFNLLRIGYCIFSELSCKGRGTMTPEEYKVTQCPCSNCKGFESSHLLGTNAYGLDYMAHLEKVYGNTNPFAKSVLTQGYADEVVEQKLKNHSSFENTLHQHGFVSESRETMTRTARRNLVAESRELRTRTARPVLAAESRETATRAAPRYMTAEMVHNPVYRETQEGTRLVAQMMDLNQMEQWQSVTVKNSVIVQNSNGGYVNATFVRGRTLLVVYHFIESLVDKTFYICPLNGTRGNEINLEQCIVKQLVDANGQKIDLALVTVPNQPSRPDIVSKFATANEINEVAEGDYVLSGLRKLPSHVALYSFEGKSIDLAGGFSYDSSRGPCRIHKSAFYHANTKSGDCGFLLYGRNRALSGKIFGTHVAGKDGKGMACVVSREFLQRHLDLMALDVPSRMTVDARLPFSAEMKQVPLKDVLPDNTLTQEGNCLSLGMLPSPSASSVTQLRPSLVDGVLQKRITKPAYLKPTKINGETIDPMRKGIKKVMTYNDSIDQEILDIACDDVANVHANVSANKAILTYEQAIAGVEDHPYLTPLNRTTSPGYPYQLDNPGVGKRFWFGYDDYEFSPEVRLDVEELIRRCRNNQRGDVVWTATLKDERRPIEKVEAGKTRVFTAGPQHYTIAMRMYFLRFVESMMENRISNEVGVGTNVYSSDWHRTGTALQRYGDKVIAGDFSNFDGSLRQDILWKILDMINDWYDDGQENRLIREVLFEEICNARVLVNGELIQWDHSQPSGNPGTVIFNSLFNQIVMRYAYLLCKEDAGLPLICDFTDKVSMQTYGDDNVLNVSDEVIEWYNQETITEKLAEIGLTYTDEAKTGTLVPYRHLDDISYLKRRFVMNSYGFYQPPLDLSVCYEMPNWIRTGAGGPKYATYVNCDAAIKELYFHGRRIFDDARLKLQNALRKEGIFTRLWTFEELRHFYESQYF
ncbi:hypothetical protein 1 [Beihai picorna-like virus 81]|uniref:hypothetical protein 1 n=1 Tax=Beihai picorna-like virus 81 TaxID=1922629 RepID=UPI000909E3F2|nr:hypothetical protein 1 [Beihai picorna-like virus 81]APG77931.1 hypothetical protein 1 [Beihai picorna-like virus 81]